MRRGLHLIGRRQEPRGDDVDTQRLASITAVIGGFFRICARLEGFRWPFQWRSSLQVPVLRADFTDVR